MKTKVREILDSEDTAKEKVEYLWGYYRWHVIISVVALFFVGYLFVDWMNRPITVFHVTVLAPEVLQQEAPDLTSDLNELLKPEGRNETAYATFTAHGRTADRFVAQITAAEYDVILMNQRDFEEYAANDNMMAFRLSGLSEEDYYQPDNYDEPIGIDSSQLAVFDGYETTKDLVVMIPGNTKRRDAIEDFFETQGYEIEFFDTNQ
ncbi:hypothetical protein [Alkalibacterium sp. 20]|uniref:hypothetical protein n=1 Tax=Alkalibacterium sp. 20 TaxID=1798803 RepID=UPI0009003BD1|nr:hypothetical protein [Alkalibacterium sp. 20]OJF94740.1 hypothetical protein AX762_07245 [Alkalibacterium sp. 20]